MRPDKLKADTTQAILSASAPVPPGQLAIAASVVGLAAIFLRLPFRTHLPPTWDSVQYLLGILHYDITMHRPHPPGYYLYVHSAKLLAGLGLHPYTALVALSLLAGGLTVALLTWWAGSLLGKRGAVAAAVFTLFSPLSWVYATHGDTYAVSGFFSVLVGYLCWRLLTVEAEPIWPSAFALGLAGGFRPTDAVFLLALWLWCARHKGVGQIGAGIVLLGLLTAAWAVPMIADAGGWSRYRAVSGQLGSMVKRLAPLMGNAAALREFAGDLFASACALLLAAWPLALFARSRDLPTTLKEVHPGTFLLLWSAPALLFYLVVHFAQAGYLMLVLPAAVLVLTVGFVRLSKLVSPAQLWGALGLIVVLNLAFTWSVFISRDRQREAGMHQLIAACSQLSGTDTVGLTGTRGFGQSHAERPMLNFRLAMYLLPQIPVYVFPLENPLRGGGSPNYGYQLSGDRIEPPVGLRGVHNLLLLDPDLLQLLPPGLPVRRILDNPVGHVYLVRLPSGATLTLGPEGQFRLTPYSDNTNPAQGASR